MLCSNCKERPIFAKQVCQRCYWRLRRTGSLERTNIQNMGRTCSVEGCDKPAHAKGMCATHYEDSRHPLNHLWRLLRSRNVDAYPFSWNRFDSFLADVGDRPDPRSQLRRLRLDEPFSKTNFHWTIPIGKNKSALSPEEQAAYGREWHLNRKFKITGEDYATLLNAQGGGCAVCGRKETHRHASGKIKDLSVDHDHETGAVRGLLCMNCNQAIGRFQDSPRLLRKAADYLEQHSHAFVSDMTLVATLPTELGAITGLRVENGSLIASSESGVDYVVPANRLPKEPETCAPASDSP